MNVGAPVEMPWYDEAKAILVCWFSGMEMGNALGDVLSGDAEPSGRLPFTWPKRLEDHPAHGWYPGQNGTMAYKEGLLVGHRWYDKRGIAPLAHFGGGLGYGDVRIESVDSLDGDVRTLLTNAGNRKTRTTVQVYLENSAPSHDEPIRKLAAFAKTDVMAGDATRATIKLERRAFSKWSIEDNAWQVDPRVKICVGLSAVGPFKYPQVDS